jgi:hypothetical protein
MVHVTNTPTFLAFLTFLAPVGAEALAPPPSTVAELARDTTFAVSPGERLALRGLAGSVEVTGWDRDEVWVRTNTDDELGVAVRRADGAIQIRPEQGGEEKGRFFVSVPVWMELDVEGSELDVSVVGMRAPTMVRTGEGDVEVIEAEGGVAARSVEGTVTVVDVVGPVVAASGDDDVIVRRVRGSVLAQTVDGDVTLEDVTASELEGSTVDGDVFFSGPLASDGQYRLVTHDGDVVVQLDPDVGASVVVSTFDGDFASDFPVTMERFSAGQELRFTLGGGGAQLTLEAFDGSIQVRSR